MRKNTRGEIVIGILVAIAFGYILGYAFAAGPYKHEGKPVTPAYQEQPGRR